MRYKITIIGSNFEVFTGNYLECFKFMGIERTVKEILDEGFQLIKL